MDARLVRTLALGQGAYWFATGIWPIAHLGSFERVTGRKRDRWLVRTTGALIAAVGATLLAGGARGRAEAAAATALLGATTAAALGGAGGWYALRGTIRKVYLADAVVEAGLVVAWAVSAARSRTRAGAPPRAARRPARPSPSPRASSRSRPGSPPAP